MQNTVNWFNKAVIYHIFFEGYSAEILRLQLVSEERTMLKSAVGKMTGCLLGAGVILVVANLINF
jgi:hypothetical protein